MAIEPPHIPGLTDWRPLARGGFAVVWEARQASLDRLVAVKVDQRRLDVESERLRFLREAGAAGRMSAHPGIVTVHDAGILSDDRPYLVMDLFPGGSLTRYLKPESRPTEQRVRDIGIRIADALAATHARGVLHRDVKPANLLIDAYDNVGLADFGLAAMPGPGLASQETFEALTPAYTAPEILRRQAPTPQGDVYSLAATLYALLGGRPPRWPESGTPTLVEVLQLQQRPVAPLPEANRALMQVLMTALSLDPTARPDAAQFRDQLAAVDLDGAPPASGGAAPLVSAGSSGAAGPAVGAASAGSRAGGAASAGSRAGGAASAGSRAGGRRSLIASLVGLVLVAVLVTALALAGRSAGPVAVPAPPPSPANSSEPGVPSEGASSAGAPTTAAPEPSQPTPVAVPDGFAACSEEQDRDDYCPSTPECWAGIISVFDSPAIGTPQDCDETHVYQTFVAAPLTFDVRKQSQLEEDRRVRRLCSERTLRTMVQGSDRDTDWEILSLPPQEDDGTTRIYRCIFGRGDRSAPVPLNTGR